MLPLLPFSLRVGVSILFYTSMFCSEKHDQSLAILLVTSCTLTIKSIDFAASWPPPPVDWAIAIFFPLTTFAAIVKFDGFFGGHGRRGAGGRTGGRS